MSDAPLSVGDVFPVRGFPRYTYQHRAAMERAVQEYASSGSGVLLVFGPTKSGKSVLVQKMLPDALYVEAPSADSAETLWNTANAKLGTLTTRSRGRETGLTHELETGIGLKAWWVRITGKWKVAGTKKDSTGGSATDPSNVVVTTELLKQRRVLVIDDLHMLPRSEQRTIVQNIKPFVDAGGRAVIIAAGHRAEFIPTLVPNMGGSFHPLRFGLWDDPSALAQIAIDGWKKLNLVPPLGLANELAENSFGSPQTMQRLSAQWAKVNGHSHAAEAPIALPDLEDGPAFYRSSLDEILPEVRWVKKFTDGPEGKGRNPYPTHNYGDADGYRLIMLALRELLPSTSTTAREIQRRISEITVGSATPLTPRQVETTAKLKLISKIASLPVMDTTKEDDLDATVEQAGVDPVVEYQEQKSTFKIVDPLFAFALRWWPI